MPTATRETAAIHVVSDANVVLKWFHAHGESGVDSARALLSAHRDRKLVAQALDLTRYEVGNALLTGPAQATPETVAAVLDALTFVCQYISPGTSDLRLAASLVVRHSLSFYDAVYAAVAQNRGAELATFDKRLLRGGLGHTPDQVLANLSD